MKENEIRKLESEIHNEFQLERVILFSDAVFAIAITLMVIELKFPEIRKNETADEFWVSAAPVILNFIAFIGSFCFIGLYWYKHLKLCGLLVDYNRTFIVLNLVFLFFIVLFPFSVSSFMHLLNSFWLFATIIYLANIFFMMVTHFILYMYLLGKGKIICKPVSVNERKILLEDSFVPIILLTFMSSALILSRILLQKYPDYSGLVVLPFALFALLIRRRLKARHKKIKAEIISNLNSNG